MYLVRKRGDGRPLADPGEVSSVLVAAHPRHPPRVAPVRRQEQHGDVRRVPDGVELEVKEQFLYRVLLKRSFPGGMQD